MTDMVSPALFRPEAIFHRRHQGEGHPRLGNTPPGAGPMCIVLLVAATAGLVYLARSEYTRKATVAGYVQMNNMTKRIYSPVQGTVTAIRVSPGQQVARNQSIATVDTASSIGDRDRRRMLAEFARQIDDANKRITARCARQRAQRDEIASRMASARTSLVHVGKILKIQHEKVAQLRKTRDLARPLFDSGQLSRLEWGRFTESLLDSEAQLERLSAEASDDRDKIGELTIALRKSSIDADSDIAELKQEMSRIEQSRHSLAARATVTIHASIGGTIANIFIQPGETVFTRRPVASISPRDTHVVASLLIPSSAAGFIHKGQRINLLYDAFPYREFGVFPARLTGISRHALAPGDAEIALPGGQPYFRGIAAIDHPWVTAGGRKIPLRPGMSLKADILLERQSLLGWLIDPLSALGARNP